MATKRPDFVFDEHLTFLDKLRESGKTNMWGAVPYMEEEFCEDADTLGEIHSYWMHSFTERHPPTPA